MNLGCIIEGEIRLKPDVADHVKVADLIHNFEVGFKPKVIIEDL